MTQDMGNITPSNDQTRTGFVWIEGMAGMGKGLAGDGLRGLASQYNST